MKKYISLHNVALTAMLSAIAFVLMLLEFPIPFLIPAFVKFDFSELPALLASFALGPIYGCVVCLLKNLIHLTVSTSGGVGELCNFLLGCAFVIPTGIIYKRKKNRKRALIGCAIGSLAMAALSFPLNYYISYPMYARIMPLEAILQQYQEIIPSADSLASCLLLFNVPFTALKGIVDTLIAFLIYKPLSPHLKGKSK